jgi:catechol 2,3-dioxygenase-like lactoylglutathione lyase family enzyme
MPKLDRLLESALYVDDPKRSAHFYQRLFGFDLIRAGEQPFGARSGGLAWESRRLPS